MSNIGPAADNTRYEVISQLDEESKDILLPIPPTLLKKLGWKEGDNIEFGVDPNGKYILKRVEK